MAEILCCSPETLNDEWEELVDRMGIVRKRGKHKRTAALTQAIKRGCVRVKPDSGGEQADPEQQKNPQ